MDIYIITYIGVLCAVLVMSGTAVSNLYTYLYIYHM
jgi:hypothetical protein